MLNKKPPYRPLPKRRLRRWWRHLRLRWITRGGRYPWCNRDGECVLRPNHPGDCDWGE